MLLLFRSVWVREVLRRRGGHRRARAAIADGLGRWELRLREGLTRMRERGKLAPSADPAIIATTTMACLQGGLLLTQVRRDPEQLRIALDAARTLLHAARPT